MSDINSVALTGRLGADPDLKYTANNDAVASANLAVQGFKKDETHWIRLVAWRKTAETLANHCRKGSRVGVTGRLQVRNWEDQSGQKRSVVEVVVNELTFLDSKPVEGGQQKPQGQGYPPRQSAPEQDIPF